jgi:hypothetical protein
MSVYTIRYKLCGKHGSTEIETLEDAQKVWDYFEMAGLYMVSERPFA